MVGSGVAGVGGSGGGEKWRQLYLNNNKKLKNMYILKNNFIKKESDYNGKRDRIIARNSNIISKVQ